jgi:TIR domain
MTRIFISHSSAAGPQARAFIDTLASKLTAAGVASFLDDDDLCAGDVWRPIIYRELATCDGAVLVLDPTALTRPWVTKEATILSWRCALAAYGSASGHREQRIRVLVVLVDGVTPDQVEKAFPALYLGDLQQLVISSRSVDGAREMAEKAAELFPPQAHLDDPLQWWTTVVSVWLRPLPHEFLTRLEGILGITEPDFGAEARCDSLADALLHRATFDDVAKALNEVLVLRTQNSGDIVNAVLPMAVPAQTASVLLRALRSAPGTRLVALNASQPATGELFVQRATCCDSQVKVAVTPVLVSADADTLYREVVACMGEKAGADPPESLQPSDMQYVPVQLVVLLPRVTRGGEGLPMRVLEALLRRLRVDYPTCVFLLLAGPEYDDDVVRLVPSDLHAEPPLSPGDEKRWSFTVQRLRNEVRQVTRV